MTENISNTYKCHQISRVLLRQFAKDKKIAVFSKDGSRGLNISENIGFTREDKALYQATEARWEIVENRFNDVIASVESGTLLKNPLLSRRVKQLISLHFVRSLATQKLFQQLEKESFDHLVIDHNAQNMDAAAVRMKWEVDLEKLKLQGIIDTMTKVQAFVDTCYLEIAEAGSNTGFILGDNPVINLRLDGPSGIIQGVGITTSDVIFLPISPRFAVSLTQKKDNSRYNLFNTKSVRLLNKKTKNQSIQEFYAKPV